MPTTTETKPSNGHRSLLPVDSASMTDPLAGGAPTDDLQNAPSSNITIIGTFAHDDSFVDAMFQVFQRLAWSMIAPLCVVATALVYVAYCAIQPAIAFLFGIGFGWEILRMILSVMRIRQLRQYNRRHPETLPNTNISIHKGFYSPGIKNDNGNDNNDKVANIEENESMCDANDDVVSSIRKAGNDKTTSADNNEHAESIVISGQYLDPAQAIVNWKIFFLMPTESPWRWCTRDPPSPPPLVGKKIWIPLQSIVDIQIRDCYEAIQMNVLSQKKLNFLKGLMLWYMKPMKHKREIVLQYQHGHVLRRSSCDASSEACQKENIIIKNNINCSDNGHVYSALDEKLVVRPPQNGEDDIDEENLPERTYTQCLHIQEPEKFVTFIQSLLGSSKTDEHNSLSLV